MAEVQGKKNHEEKINTNSKQDVRKIRGRKQKTKLSKKKKRKNQEMNKQEIILSSRCV